MIRLLTFTTLYPNAARPTHGIFVENRIRQLVESGAATTRVIAPVPYFPSQAKIFGQYAQFARVPRHEIRHGLDVAHPRFPLLPRISMVAAPLSLYLASRAAIKKVRRDGYEIDLIDAHYFYPDGVAAILLGREFDLPVVITARGSDLNLIPQFTLPRRMIQWAATRAAGLITVSAALKQQLESLGVEADRVRVLRNGVDLTQFRPLDRDAIRARMGLQSFTLVSAGNLVSGKGHDLVIEALASLPGACLLIAGDGPEEPALRALVQRLGLSQRVRFLGRQAYEAMPEIYAAADVLVLASAREGWPNVLLEAMACGTPVAATDVGGIAEIITAPQAGRLIAAQTPAAIAASVAELQANLPDRADTRRHAEGFSWDETTVGQVEFFSEILQQRR